MFVKYNIQLAGVTGVDATSELEKLILHLISCAKEIILQMDSLHYI